MTLTLAILIYAAAMTLANLSLSYFGPASIPFNAFLFIGLDLTLRDRLHTRLSKWQMLALIVVSGCFTYLMDASAGHFAAASGAAFICAGIADWAAFTVLRGSWLLRSNGSNVIGAAVDSVAFPALAFGGIDPSIVLTMFAAKVAGGAMWSALLIRRATA